MNRFFAVLLLATGCAAQVEPEGEVGSELPEGFLLGTSTAAHQIEGNNRNNDWWDWEQSDAGHIRNGDTSEKAAGSWGRFQSTRTNAPRRRGFR